MLRGIPDAARRGKGGAQFYPLSPYGARVPDALDSGSRADWAITAMTTLAGKSRADVAGLTIRQGGFAQAPAPVWSLHGIASQLRNTAPKAFTQLSARGSPLGRGDTRGAALMPISKSET
jgi:hypothetical protein